MFRKGIALVVMLLFVGLSIVPATGYINELSFLCKSNNPPYIPSNPIPSNGSSNVTPTCLEWTGGDPDGDNVTYDVYFGKTTPPQLIVVNISQTIYCPPGNWEFNTTYYWKVVAWDEHGASTEGPIWTFTTQENLPPNKASDPFPEDGAMGVPVIANVSWTGSDPNQGEPLTYNVYFGVTNPPNMKSSNQTGNSYDPLGNMELFKKYYWYIVTWDSQGQKAVGDVWTFTTFSYPPDPPIITGPKKGTAGENYWYNFSYACPEGNDISFQIQWGDGDEINWTEYYPSGTKIKRNHTWDEKDDYIIRCRVKDIWGVIGIWAEYPVSMPKNRQSQNMLWFLRWLERFPILQKILDVLRLNIR